MNKKKSIFWAGIILAAGAAIILSLRISKDARIDPDSAVFNYRKLLQEGNGHHLGLLRKTLYKQLRHNDLMVRMNVAEVMGELDDPGTIKKLWRITVQEKTPIVREAAVEGMCLLRDKKALKYLRRLIKDEAVSVRRKAVECFDRIGEKAGFLDLESAFWDEEDELTKIMIAMVMAHFGDRDRLGFVLDVLKFYPDHEYRAYVADSLFDYPVDVDGRMLKNIFEREKNEIVKVKVAGLLTRVGDEAGKDFLLQTLVQGKDAKVRAEAAWVLVSQNKRQYMESAYPFILQLLKEDDWHIREIVFEMLDDYRNYPIMPLLAETLATDKHPVVREIAAWSMGERRDPAALPYLEKGLYDSSPDVRTGVLAAIYKILKSEEKK